MSTMYEMISLKTDERTKPVVYCEYKQIPPRIMKWIGEYEIRIQVKINVQEIGIPETEERHIIEVKNSLLEIVRRIQDNFDDFRSRQIGFFDFKKALMSARREFRKNLTLLELMICLFDVVENLHSENLTKRQLDILGNIADYISNEVTDMDIENATQELISAGLNPLPSLSGLSEIYREQGEI